MTTRPVLDQLVRLRNRQRDMHRARHADASRDLQTESDRLQRLVSDYGEQLVAERASLLVAKSAWSTELSGARLRERRQEIAACRRGIEQLRETRRRRNDELTQAEIELTRAERRQRDARREAMRIETCAEQRSVDDFVAARFGGDP